MSRDIEILKAQLLNEAAEIIDNAKNEELKYPVRVAGIIVHVNNEAKVSDDIKKKQIKALNKFDEKYRDNFDKLEKTIIKALYDTAKAEFEMRKSPKSFKELRFVHATHSYYKRNQDLFERINKLTLDEFTNEFGKRIDYQIYTGEGYNENDQLAYISAFSPEASSGTSLWISNTGTATVDPFWVNRGKKK